MHRPGKNTALSFLRRVEKARIEAITTYGVDPDTLFIGQYEIQVMRTVSKHLAYVIDTGVERTILLGMQVVVVEAEKCLKVGVTING